LRALVVRLERDKLIQKRATSFRQPATAASRLILVARQESAATIARHA
jgi:hypothetical protein